MTKAHKPPDDEPDEPTPHPKAPHPRAPAPPPKAKPVGTGPGTYRVRLSGLKPLGAEGVAQDYLDVEADSPEDAWEKFKVANGILTSIHEPEITRLPDDAR